jgi:hypothetical protein
MPDFPPVTIGVINPPEQPSVFLCDRTDLGRSEAQRPSDDVMGPLVDEQESLCRSTNRLRAEVPVRGGFVLDPERRSVNTELADNILLIVASAEAVDLFRPERSFIELDRLATSSDRELDLDGRLSIGTGHRHSVPSPSRTQRRGDPLDKRGVGMENEVVLLIIIPAGVLVGAYGRESWVSV